MLQLVESQPNPTHEKAVISRPNPIQFNQWMGPTHVQLCLKHVATLADM